MVRAEVLSKFKIILQKRDGTGSYILFDPAKENASIVESINYTGTIDTPVVDASLIVRDVGSNFISNGDKVYLVGPIPTFEGTEKQQEIHVFYVLERVNNSERANVTFELRNGAHWITSSLYWLKLEFNESVSQFIKRTTRSHDVPVSSIVRIPFQPSPELFQNTTLHDAWVKVLAMATIDTGISYRIRWDSVGLVVEEVLVPRRAWWFEIDEASSRNNMIRTIRTQSILDSSFLNELVGVIPPGNSAVASDDAEESLDVVRTVVATNANSVRKFGLFRKQVNVSTWGDTQEINRRLKFMLEDGSEKDTVAFETLALNNIIPMDRIYISHKQLDILGQYYVTSVKTTIDYSGFLTRISCKRRIGVSQSVKDQMNKSDNTPDAIHGDG